MTAPRLSHQATAKLPSPIEQRGYAQLSVIETALSPLDSSLLEQNVFETHYRYTDRVGERQQATVRVGYAFQPLKRDDDFVLWSLLSLTLRHSTNHVLTATPYWLLKQLGMFTGGHQYQVLRDAVERLSQVLYFNSGFYNPLTQEHERWQFAFFASHLPQSLDSDRLWKLVWNPPFIEASRATGGRMMFDLELFRKLHSPATRRLFLKLSDRFHRDDRAVFDLDDLTINGLGYAATVPLKVRKHKLIRSLAVLLEHGILSLGNGHQGVADLILKKGKGRYTVLFFRGPYFERPRSAGASSASLADDPLYAPMQAFGVDAPMIRRLLTNSPRHVIERWLRITEAADKEKPAGFAGFKISPAAFFVDGVLNQRMPPDWMHQLEKVQRRRAFEAEAAKLRAAERLLAAEYEKDRQHALQSFVQTPIGRQLYDTAYEPLLGLGKARGEPEPIAERQARAEALAWIDRSDEFSFPEFAVWTVARKNIGS